MNTHRSRLLILALIGLVPEGFTLSSQAEVALPPILSSHMVIQRDRAVLWGKANAGETVSATLQGQTVSTNAGKEGEWRLKFTGLKAGGPHSLLIKGENTITLDDVLIGDVWVCGGQSQMEAQLAAEQRESGSPEPEELPNLRVFLVEKYSAASPQGDVRGEWLVCAPATAGRFPALGYHFGAKLTTALKRPIGLIQTAVGGTPAEAWTPADSLRKNPALSEIGKRWETEAPEAARRQSEYQTAIEEWQRKADEASAAGSPPPARPADPTVLDQRRQPSGLFNGMIAPLTRFPIAGVIWFQGEANIPRPAEYRALFPVLIRSWRSAWGQEDLPFLFVQLPGMQFKHDLPEDSKVAELREAQAAALSVPNTMMASAIDLGEERSLQLKSKAEIAARLAQLALSRVYEKTKRADYPTFGSMKVTGDKVRLTFKNTGGALVTKSGSTAAAGFAISGSDRRFSWATAEVHGDSITISSELVKKPVAVRYAWADFPDADVKGKNGLPLLPFRTDKWEQSSSRALPAPAATAEASPAPSPEARPVATSETQPAPGASGTMEKAEPSPSPSATVDSQGAHE